MHWHLKINFLQPRRAQVMEPVQNGTFITLIEIRGCRDPRYKHENQSFDLDY